MKIAIDISQIIYGTGVSVYTRNLVGALLKVDKKNEYVLFGGSLRRKKLLDNYIAKLLENKTAFAKTFFFPPTLADFLWNRLHILPIEKLVGKMDVFHSSDWTQPPTQAAKVTTIHDLSFLKWPESVHPKVLAAQKRRLDWVKKECDLIVAVSEATKEEIIDLLQMPEKKVRVVYEALAKDVLDFKKSESLVASLKSRLGIKKPYLYAYGSQSPRKNINRLLEAFKQVKKEIDCQLVVVGRYSSEQKLPDDVVLAGFLNREQMLNILAGAELLALPSLYEGFGLIILEAFRMGVPVVTSNVSSMPEVAGGAAVLVDPFDVDDIARGIIEALKNKKKLVKKGSARVKSFSWEKTARETLGVYKEAYEIHRSERI